VSSVVALLALLPACEPVAPNAPAEVSTPAEVAVPSPAPAPAFEDAPDESPRLPVDDAAVTAAAGAATAAWSRPTVAVTVDRPLYRPGETVWARVWDLADGALGPRGATDAVVVELVDPRGTISVRRTYANAGAGAAADLTVPGGAAGGLWQVRARVGAVTLDRPIVVATFEEPRIRKELDLLRDAYGPGDEVTAALTVASSGRGPLIDHPVRVLVQVDGEALPPIEARTDTRGEATLRFTLPAHIRRADAVLTAVVEEEGWTESVSKPIPLTLDALQVEALPEGGTMVAGLPARVYVRVRDAAGQPADGEGVVEDASGTEVARFTTVHDGLGRFALTPRAGARYRVRMVAPVAGAPVELPPASDEGCVLRAYDDLDGARPELRAGVWCSPPRTVIATGGLRGRSFVPATLEAGPDAPAIVHLRPEKPEDALLQGVATVTLLGEDLRPLAERLVYRNRARALSVTLEPTATTFGPRDEVQLEVTTRDPSGEPVAAELALSVVDDRLLKHADDEHGHLVSQLYLEPHLRGTLEDPAWYFDPEEPDAGRGLDLVLGTYGWRTFVEEPPASREHAKQEEGKVGKRARVGGWPGGMPGPDAAPAELGGLIGEIAGAGGLGVQGIGNLGPGVGGGGTGEGLGALGTRGMGAGAAGYGKAGGEFIPGEGGLGAVSGDPIILGALERGLIDEVVGRHRNQIRYCYARELRKRPHLAGKIVTRFTILRDGTVGAANTKSTEMNDPSVEACVVGRFLRMTFPKPTRGEMVMVSYPITFGVNGDLPWTSAPAGPASAPYHVARVFAQPDYAGRPAPTERTDFRSTVAWLPSLTTGADGRATVRFFLADPVTTWRVTAEGVGGGHAGRAERELHATLPFSLDVPLPTEVSFGDRLLLPVRLANRRDAPTEVTLTTRIASPLVAEDGTGTQRLSLASGDGAVTVVPIAVPDVMGTAEISVTATSAALTDTFVRTLSVAPRGFPHEWQAGGALADAARHTVTIDEALGGSVAGSLVLYPSPVSSLLEGAASMVRMPGGCFEQTSSTNHPNVLVLEYLDRTGGGGGLLVDRTSVLREGYARLTGYQVAPGGFETFGHGPGKEALSAYGLLQFTRMRRVFPEVDPTVTDRDVAFLLGSRDGTGGYRSSGSSAHAYGAAPKAVNDAYITRALVLTGQLRSGAEVDQQRALARSTTDPYLLALATDTLTALGDADAPATASRLASMQAADGGFPGARSSVESAGGEDLLVETTALAALALQRAGGHADTVTSAARWLGEARRGSWGWGNTQATVLALEAIATVAAETRATPGTVRVTVDGAVVGTVSYTGAERDGVRVDLGRALPPGAHTIALTHDGDRPIPYTLEATWRRDTPADAADAPLHLRTTLAADTVAQGHPVRLLATVTNTSSSGVASPLARVRLPAGVRVETKALEHLKEQGRIAFFETRPREVTLYWEGMAAGEVQEVALDLVAEVPGTFTAPPSVVYPYYTSRATDWEAGPTLRITQ
jgi:hypothetical protein